MRQDHYGITHVTVEGKAVSVWRIPVQKKCGGCKKTCYLLSDGIIALCRPCWEKLENYPSDIPDVSGRDVIPRKIDPKELEAIKANDQLCYDPLDPQFANTAQRDRHLLLCHLAYLKQVFEKLRGK